MYAEALYLAQSQLLLLIYIGDLVKKNQQQKYARQTGLIDISNTEVITRCLCLKIRFLSSSTSSFSARFLESQQLRLISLKINVAC